jgi:hypothetical protein
MGELDFRIDNSTPTLTRGERRDSKLEFVDFTPLWFILFKTPLFLPGSGSLKEMDDPPCLTLWDMMDMFSAGDIQ